MILLATCALLVPLLPAPARAQTADPARGEEVFETCSACHSIEAGENGYGPSLHGVVGRRAGAAPDYEYSDAMRRARLVWDDGTLDRWLAGPRTLVPGTRMSFPGLPNRQERRDVIAYLKAAGGAP
ncbi:cytochrome c family protein [Inquilinus sp.]|uniref:c-type cytochrome n=1 Tax=Inquilinus sp. TaxID=1932117 RepID=UPI0031DB735B